MPRGSAYQLAIDSRRAKVAELYLQGYRSQRAIAEKLDNVSRQTVATDLQAVRKWWKADAVNDIGQAIVEELAKIDRVEREAWEAWERSKATREKQRSGKSTRDDSTSSMAQIEKEDQYGDPRFLEKVCWCIERRCKLMNLEPPKKLIIGERQIDDVIEQEFEFRLNGHAKEPING